jgi:hypothetical protein
VANLSDLYSLYGALVSINIPADKALAVVDAMERDMSTHLATKSDIESLRRDLDTGLAAVRQEIVIWLGSAIAVAAGLIIGSIQLA